MGCYQTFETLYQVKEGDDLTEDWKKSLLNYNLRNGPEFQCQDGYSEGELKRIGKNLPSEKSELEEVQRKAMKTLELLLVELLGTKKDVKRFAKRFSQQVHSTIKALISKCDDMFAVRSLRADVLKVVNARERLLRKVSSLQGKERKKAILQVYEMNKVVRGEIENWGSSDVVPFDEFIFKGKNYLERIMNDNLILQKLLLSIVD